MEIGKKALQKVSLTQTVKRSFPDSEAFMEALGRSVTAKGMFIPLRSTGNIKKGQQLDIHLGLENGKDIIAGLVRVAFVRDGANGEQPGLGVSYIELTPRSVKNLDMIKAWRDSHG